MPKEITIPQATWQKGYAEKLIRELVSGHISEIKPSLDADRELGFFFPKLEFLLNITTSDMVCLCELLVDENVLERYFWRKITLCPNCYSDDLRANLQCPRCGSNEVTKGRLLEHFICGNIATEDEYQNDGHYVCPRCNRRLKFLGTDYRSIGFSCVCRACCNIFDETTTNFECKKCKHVFMQDEEHHKEIYFYRLNPLNNHEDWLRFESNMKPQLVQALSNCGYDVSERLDTKRFSTKSNLDHALSLIGHKDNGFIEFILGVGFIFDGRARKAILEKLFRFDEKAFDLDIRDKIVVVNTELSESARLFAQQQRIKIFNYKETENFLVNKDSLVVRNVKSELLCFKNITQFLGYLERLGYVVQQGGVVEGKSGVKYKFDILARYDDGIVSRSTGIDIVSAQEPVHLDVVALFNAKAYDAAIDDKCLLVSPSLSHEASVFAKKKNIKIIAAADPADLDV